MDGSTEFSFISGEGTGFVISDDSSVSIGQAIGLASVRLGSTGDISMARVSA